MILIVVSLYNIMQLHCFPLFAPESPQRVFRDLVSDDSLETLLIKYQSNGKVFTC